MVNPVKRHGIPWGKLGAFVAALTLPLILLSSQATAATEPVRKSINVQVPSGSKYCAFDAYTNDGASGGVDLCSSGSGNLSAGWHTVKGAIVLPGDTVYVVYYTASGAFHTGRRVTVPKDDLKNLWYNYS